MGKFYLTFGIETLFKNQEQYLICKIAIQTDSFGKVIFLRIQNSKWQRFVFETDSLTEYRPFHTEDFR